MAPVQLVLQFALTVPAGTAASSPVSLPMQLPNMDVAWIEYVVPPGPGGEVGFWVGSHGESIIPFSNSRNPWIITDDERVHWDLANQMDSGDWELVGYNVGRLDHVITVRFGLAPVGNGAANPAVVPSLVSLTGTLPGA